MSQIKKIYKTKKCDYPGCNVTQEYPNDNVVFEAPCGKHDICDIHIRNWGICCVEYCFCQDKEALEIYSKLENYNEKTIKNIKKQLNIKK